MLGVSVEVALLLITVRTLVERLVNIWPVTESLDSAVGSDGTVVAGALSVVAGVVSVEAGVVYVVIGVVLEVSPVVLVGIVVDDSVG